MSRAKYNQGSVLLKKAGKGAFFLGLGEATFGAIANSPPLMIGGLATSIMGGLGTSAYRKEYVRKKVTMKQEAKYLGKANEYVQKKYPKDLERQAKVFGKTYEYMLSTTKRR
jgi:hypothetical protein